MENQTELCPICGKPAHNPYRRYTPCADGIGHVVVEGCIDAFHTGRVYNDTWHNRKCAVAFRKEQVEKKVEREAEHKRQEREYKAFCKRHGIAYVA